MHKILYDDAVFALKCILRTEISFDQFFHRFSPDSYGKYASLLLYDALFRAFLPISYLIISTAIPLALSSPDHEKIIGSQFNLIPETKQ